MRSRLLSNMRGDEIIKKLSELCGVSFSRVPVPDDTDADGIKEDAAAGRTVFSVERGKTSEAYAIDGIGGGCRAIAKLSREYILRSMVSAESGSLVRDFLCGSGIEPAVRVGKCDYYVFAVYCKTRHAAVREYLEAMATPDDFVADMDGGVTAFCKRSDGDDYQSAGEFAVVLRENLSEEIDDNIKIGVGGVAHGLSELPTYYFYAKSALGAGAEFDPLGDVYSYKEYALIRVLSELPAATTEKYVKTVLDKNYRAVLGDEELMTAADAFIKHSLNISEASRSMYVHRNTLIYRLDKIEKMTGLNIRNFNDAMSFRVAYLISKSMR